MEEEREEDMLVQGWEEKMDRGGGEGSKEQMMDVEGWSVER